MRNVLWVVLLSLVGLGVHAGRAQENQVNTFDFVEKKFRPNSFPGSAGGRGSLHLEE